MTARQPHTGRKHATRVITWACLSLIPILAVLTVGSGLLPGLSADTSVAVPGGLQLAETRALAAAGDDLASVAPASTDGTLDGFMNSWQNTVRRRPSPRR